MIDINIHAATRPEDFNPCVSWQETINGKDYLTTSITLGAAPTCYLYLRPNQIVQLRAVLDEALEKLAARPPEDSSSYESWPMACLGDDDEGANTKIELAEDFMNDLGCVTPEQADADLAKQAKA